MADKEKVELWDVYTKDRIKTDKKHIRGKKKTEGEYRLVVHICIFNSKNEMLIQQRQPFKHGWPNMWDLTVGGSSIAGESSTEAAEREVYEELGLKINLSNTRPSFTINFQDGFDDYYLIKHDVDIEELALQKEEVRSVKWAGKEEILKMQEDGTFIPYWFLDKLFDMDNWYDAFRNSHAEFTVKLATEKNLNSWMSMVEIVRDNFPGLETDEKLIEYKNTVKKMIDSQTAVCALYGNMVVGILLFSTKHNMLCCMAVHPEFRRKQIATKMCGLMLEKLDRTRPIVVETFREEDARGVVPRAFYKNMGFVEGEACLSEDNYPTQKFYLETI